MDPAVVTRFAPSPTGALHPGNARTALFSFLLARSRGGRFVAARRGHGPRARQRAITSRPSSRTSPGSDIDWDAGPGRDDGRGPYRQSERGEPVRRTLRAARARGPRLSVLLHARRARGRAPDAARGRRAAAISRAPAAGSTHAARAARAARPDARPRCASRSRPRRPCASTTWCAARRRWRRRRSAISWCGAPTAAPCSSSAMPWTTR